MKKIGILLTTLFLVCSPVFADTSFPIETEEFEWDTFSFQAPAGWEKRDSDLDIFYSLHYTCPDPQCYLNVVCYTILQEDLVTSQDIIDSDFTDRIHEADEYYPETHYEYDEVETYFSGRYPICIGHCVETLKGEDEDYITESYKIVFYDKEGYKAEISYTYFDEPDEDILEYFKILPETIVLK